MEDQFAFLKRPIAVMKDRLFSTMGLQNQTDNVNVIIPEIMILLPSQSIVVTVIHQLRIVHATKNLVPEDLPSVQVGLLVQIHKKTKIEVIEIYKFDIILSHTKKI